MSKMKEIIEKLQENRETARLYIPDKGYVYAKVESLIDDVVTIDPESGNKIVIHYTQFAMERI